MAARPPRFNHSNLLDGHPLPPEIPAVPEIGVSSAPLMSASFFIGARCGAFNDDYMKCKTEAHGTGEFDCMREGRKVTRCAASVLDDISKHCLTDFRRHWDCLENNNQQMYHCRLPEQILNKCVFDSLGLEKKIPGAPKTNAPVNERKRNIYGTGYEANVGTPEIVEKYKERMRQKDERVARRQARTEAKMTG